MERDFSAESFNTPFVVKLKTEVVIGRPSKLGDSEMVRDILVDCKNIRTAEISMDEYEYVEKNGKVIKTLKPNVYFDIKKGPSDKDWLSYYKSSSMFKEVCIPSKGYSATSVPDIVPQPEWTSAVIDQYKIYVNKVDLKEVQNGESIALRTKEFPLKNTAAPNNEIYTSKQTFHLVLCAEKLKADISTLYFKNDYEYGNEASRILVFRDDHQTIKEAEHNGKWEPLSSKFANSFGICQ